MLSILSKLAFNNKLINFSLLADNKKYENKYKRNLLKNSSTSFNVSKSHFAITFFMKN